MLKTEQQQARERILDASVQLFSQKGYDGTRVSEIAEAANVTKALIYYYFKSKEDILDHLVRFLLDNATAMTMDFIHTNIVQMIKDGRLDILPDRLHFNDNAAIRCFLENVQVYFEKVLDYLLQYRHILRIFMLESLKDSKHNTKLFRLMDFFGDSEKNLLLKTISAADQDFNYTPELLVFKFFYAICPIVSFAVYYDDYQKMSNFSDDQLRTAFLQSSRIIFGSLVSGQDILLKNNQLEKDLSHR
ncbi:TetR/AcrR family transcriptional regulator [Capillibacterium thermochitinicola]|uniref:TetR/AcrR family transcriptional regulator n=1 Tax=Capillibacterium thermochitinicola TaxID=2699427 RepID=A0A8J6I2V0_9FIRM|nr:TetR/AcrR family transcriptional regulator [Capillibacterium thermochitinicola]MBA2133943.1 TetR/AcrR family transcriptional regulator [Capillibacterium thermochitinicola]